MPKGKTRPPQRGDTRGRRWVGIPFCVVESAAYRDLTLWARAILIEIVHGFSGSNNGKIAISFRQLAERLNNTNYRQISRAIVELREHGFIEVMYEGEWMPRLAREYRLTFISTGTNENPIRATNEYLHWKKSGDDDVSAHGGKAAVGASAKEKKAADDVSAKIARQRKKCVTSENFAADDVSALIDNHTRGQENRPPTSAHPERYVSSIFVPPRRRDRPWRR